MGTNSIPKNVDCIVIGTGLTNSILAAACSRIGKSVLHIDRNSYYGNDWASFTFQQLIDWIKVNRPEDECLKSIQEELITKSRMFCIDLCPRLLYSNGEMVKLLVKSNVSRYHEFKNNIRILSMIGDEIHIMPCRRSDVFTSPLLSDLIDKRRLMKFIELCIKFDPHQETPESKEILQNADKPIGEYLDERGLKFTLREYIINSIAMIKPTDTTRKACEKIKHFMVATERFGRSPFIYPIYGCGEFPQSFCRLSAVFGGIYCLNTQIDDLSVGMQKESQDCLPDETTTATNNEPSGPQGSKFHLKVNEFSCHEFEVTSDMLVMEHKIATEFKLGDQKAHDKLARAILITKASVAPNDENLLSFLRIPPNQTNANTVYLLELNSSVMVCPQDYKIVYLWTRSTTEQSNNAEDDLGPTVERIFSDNTNAIVWKFYYHQLMGRISQAAPVHETGGKVAKGLYITSPQCDDIDYDHNISEAERIFKTMCPDQEFLPRAPDPDEIISQI